MASNSTWLKIVYFILSSLLPAAPALYNRYPLVYFDSGAYMEMAANFSPSFHRAFGYPLLIKFTGFMVSNWPLIILQGLVISLLLFEVLRLVLHKFNVWKAHFLTLVFLCFGSALPWYSSQLMPDVWTFIMVLTFAVVSIAPSLSNLKLGLLLLLLLLSLLTHMSNVPLLFLIAAGFGLLAWLRSDFRMFGLKWRMLMVAGVLLAASLITSSVNALHGHGFRYSLASNVFITANLAEMGILKMYLDEQCAEKPNVLCSLGEKLPIETGGFLWDPAGPVMVSQGGWAGADRAYQPIVNDFLTKPRYLKWFLFSGFKATVKQMFQIELGSGLQYAYGEGSPPYWPMKSHYKQELNEYLNSVQNKGDELPIGFFRGINYLTLFLSIALLGWGILSRRLPTYFIGLLIIFCFAYFFNAAITGVLANVYDRLQVRLLPLLQMMALIWAMDYVPWFKRILQHD